MVSDEEVERIAGKALEQSVSDPLLANKVTRLAANYARRQTRAALLRQIKPFNQDDDPPDRATDPLSRAAFFSTPASAPSDPAPLPVPKHRAPLNKTERQQAAREFFALVFRESTATLEDFSPARTRCFFRLVRELARHTRVLDETSPLSALPLADWSKPLRAQPVLGRFSTTSALLREGPDLALLPPPAPDDLTNYDPAQDAPLVHYCAVLRALADDLRLAEGTKTEPYLGRYGLKGLLDPLFVRLACPSPAEVLAWEEQLVFDTLHVLLRRGAQGCYAWLKTTHGLETREAAVLVGAANDEAMKRAAGGVEEKRALSLLRLEDLQYRARRAANLPAELGAMKLQALVAGLARVEPENAITEFVQTVKKVNAESPKQLDLDDTDEDEDEPT